VRGWFILYKETHSTDSKDEDHYASLAETSIPILALAYVVIILWVLTFYAPNVIWVMVLTIASLVISLAILKLAYDVYRKHYGSETEHRHQCSICGNAYNGELPCPNCRYSSY
jgi:hypothetical protein